MAQTGVHVEIGGSSKKLVTEVDKAEKSLDGFNREGKKTNNNLGKLTKSFKMLSVGVVATATAMAGLTVVAADNAKEISNLSRVAGVSTTEFQRMAFAAKTVGIEQDKLSGILKDVNDRAGDLLTEKSGELAEFFKRLGISAEEASKMIKGLSSRDTLQLMVKLMKEAGFNMQEMTSGMEMVASDATLLIPLLKDNASEMERLGDKASDLGVVLSGETLDGMQTTSEKINEMTAAFKGLGNIIVDEASPALNTVIDGLTTIAGIGRVVIKDALGGNELSETAQEAENLRDKFIKAQRQARELKKEMSEDGFPSEDIEDYTLRISGLEQISRDALKAINELKGESPTVFDGGLTGVISGTPKAEESTDIDPKLLAWRNTWRQIKEEGIKANEEQAALEKENNEKSIAEAKRASDRRIDIARMERNEKFRLTASAFSDLSSLMESGNKDLFEIGKTAAAASIITSGINSAEVAYLGGLKVSGGNPLVGAAFAAASGAATLTRLSALNSTQFNSNSGGGGALQGGGSGAQAVAQQAPTKNVNISVDGDSVSKQQLGSIAEQLQAEIDDGAILTGITFS